MGKECMCGFCKLRKIENDNTLSELRYLEQRKKELIKNNQIRNKELISLCVETSLTR